MVSKRLTEAERAIGVQLCHQLADAYEQKQIGWCRYALLYKDGTRTSRSEAGIPEDSKLEHRCVLGGFAWLLDRKVQGNDNLYDLLENDVRSLAAQAVLTDAIHKAKGREYARAGLNDGNWGTCAGYNNTRINPDCELPRDLIAVLRSAA